jgi:hypothetical protein
MPKLAAGLIGGRGKDTKTKRKDFQSQGKENPNP